MKICVLYNGYHIRVEDEYGHYRLSCGSREQRCDVGELNEAIPEFAEELDNEMNIHTYIASI